MGQGAIQTIKRGLEGPKGGQTYLLASEVKASGGRWFWGLIIILSDEGTTPWGKRIGHGNSVERAFRWPHLVLEKTFKAFSQVLQCSTAEASKALRLERSSSVFKPF